MGDSLSPAESSGSETVGESFGRYRIVSTLGEGAMGSVHLAEDSMLQRQVALKLPKFGDDDPEALERFLVEARAAANLRHPNICPVFDVGEVDGRQFITMAYIPGRPLSDYAKSSRKLNTRQVVKVVRKLALALYAAHEAGVVHRDVKPANVMVDSNGEPIVMDFGLARQTTATGVRLTATNAIMGTPAYMSPEQVSARIDDVGPASDQFSLGIVLSELLTGELPFAGADAIEVMHRIRSEPPVPVRALRPDVDAELESICLRMMAKRVEDRFDTLDDVATALTDWLQRNKRRRAAGEVDPRETAEFVHPGDSTETHSPAAPSESTPPEPPGEPEPAPSPEPSPAVTPEPLLPALLLERLRTPSEWPPWLRTCWERVRQIPPPTKWSPRAKIAGGAGAALVLVLGLVVLLRTPYGKLRIMVDDPNVEVLVDGEAIELEDLIWEGDFPARRHRLALRIGDVEVPFDENSKGFRVASGSVLVMVDGKSLAADTFEVGKRGRTSLVVALHSTFDSLTRGAVLQGHSHPVVQVTFTPDGSRVVSACNGDTVKRKPKTRVNIYTGGPGNDVRVWNAETGEQVRQFSTNAGKGFGAQAIDVSDDGRLLAVGTGWFSGNMASDSRVYLWDLTSGRRQWQQGALFGDAIRDVAFGDDDSELLVQRSGRIEVRSLAHGEIVSESAIVGRGPEFGRTMLTPDRELVVGVVALKQNEVVAWDGATGKIVKSFTGHTATPTDVAVSPDGTRLLTCAPDLSIRLWDFETGDVVRKIDGLASKPTCLAFSPSGRQFLAGSEDGKVTLYDADSGRPVVSAPGHGGSVRDVAFSPDGRRAVTGGNDGAVRLWSLSSSRVLVGFHRPRIRPISELNVGGTTTAPWPTSDGLRLYYEGPDPDGGGAVTLVAERASAKEPFGKPEFVVRGQNASLSEDELQLVCVGPRGRIHRAERAERTADFGELQEILRFRTLWEPKSPWISADGETVVVKKSVTPLSEFVQSDKSRFDEVLKYQLPQVAGMTERAHGSPITWPFLSKDGLRIWYGRGSNRRTQIWTGTRATTDEAFRDFEPVRVNGQNLIGVAPRHVPATNELVFARPRGKAGWELAVVENYAPYGEASIGGAE